MFIFSWPFWENVGFQLVEGAKLNKLADFILNIFFNQNYISYDIFDLDFQSYEEFARYGYENNILLRVKRGEIVRLEYDSAAGDNLESMWNYLAQNHAVAEGGSLKLRIMPGAHYQNTGLLLSMKHIVDVEGDPFLSLQITDANIVEISPGIYEIEITTATDLPSYLNTNYSVGAQNCKGTNSAQILNGGHRITAITGARKLKYQTRGYSQVTNNPIVFNNTTTLGLLANRLIINPACLLLDNQGWNGNTTEGFLNQSTGGIARFRNIAFTYLQTIVPVPPATDEHDIFFASDSGTILDMQDCIVAGTGDKIGRNVNAAEFKLVRNCLGCGTTGHEVIQSAGGFTNLTRNSMSSASVSALTSITGSNMLASSNIIAGSAKALRNTFEDGGDEGGATLTYLTGRISHCQQAITLTRGVININALVEVDRCDFFASFAGGILRGGDQSLAKYTNILNAIPPSNVYINGGGWYLFAEELQNINFVVEQNVGVIIPAIVAMAGGTINTSNVYTSLPNLKGGDILLSECTGQEPKDTISVDFYYDSPGQFYAKIINFGTAPVSRTAKTYLITWIARP